MVVYYFQYGYTRLIELFIYSFLNLPQGIYSVADENFLITFFWLFQKES